MTEVNRKLEQRMYRVESEKQALLHQQEEALEQLRHSHRLEMSRYHDDKGRALNDLRKEYEAKVIDDMWYMER